MLSDSLWEKLKKSIESTKAYQGCRILLSHRRDLLQEFGGWNSAFRRFKEWFEIFKFFEYEKVIHHLSHTKFHPQDPAPPRGCGGHPWRKVVPRRPFGYSEFL